MLYIYYYYLLVFCSQLQTIPHQMMYIIWLYMTHILFKNTLLFFALVDTFKPMTSNANLES